MDLRENDVAHTDTEFFESTPSDLNSLDIAWCLLTAIASTFITTNKGIEEWLGGVHDAASEQSGNFDFIQKALGVIFHHKGDWMDKMVSRDSDSTYIAFHRLLWGHDPLAVGKGIGGLPFNPIWMMIEQEKSERSGFGLLGALQAMRHLLADTFSKQGLPLPGFSWLDCANPEGKAWNHIIDIVQGLSVETTGNKAKAEELYRHLFTIRAQDIAGGTVALALTKVYIAARSIEDAVRINQIRLVAYSASFFGQAIVGTVRQNGVPYINYPLAAAMVKELARLFLESNRRTNALAKEAERLHEAAQEQILRHDRLKNLL